MQRSKEQQNTSHQSLLFGEPEATGVKIADVAQQLDVSSATIRNWLKTGYLIGTRAGTVDLQSLDSFAQRYAGKDKLTGRANKSLKDSHDHPAVTSRFLDRIATQENHLQSIGDDYQQSLSDSFRNREGIYYTPTDIVEDMLAPPATDVSSSVFCDPCCGSGNFIARAIEIGFRPENIVAYDTDPVAVALTRSRLRKLTGYDSESIYNDDFLERSLVTTAKYDYIFTNPPWGKKLPKETKQSFASIFNAGRSSDTCSLFLFACLRAIKEGGHLGLLLPEAFFNIATFEDARKAILRLIIERLIDYKKPFAGLVTGAQAIVCRAKPTINIHTSVQCEIGDTKHDRPQESFANNPKTIFNFHCNATEAAVIDHAFKKPHITLAGKAQWGLGIVTGNNKKWVQSTPSAGHVPVFRGADIGASSLREPTNFILSDFSLYQQVAPLELYTAREKLIYRFISSDLIFFADLEQRYILNSANMLIPHRDFPISCLQLADLLNSEFMNWLFKSIYNTHKVLRGDLESLPVHVQYFGCYEHFSETDYLNYLGLRKDSDGTYRIEE